MLAACLLVAGTLHATFPAAHFTVEWRHSIEHTRWRESYAVQGDRIVLTEAWIEGSGAGMDAGPDARFDGHGWRWTPALAPLREIVLTLSPYTADYELCAAGQCRMLHAWAGLPRNDTARVTIRPCAPDSPQVDAPRASSVRGARGHAAAGK
ncbi:MAG: DUF1850 domain-containing protein [Burkholderiales bacterium]|nr:DUF1850 domain-containing protein [Burkholderiales bacterium]